MTYVAASCGTGTDDEAAGIILGTDFTSSNLGENSDVSFTPLALGDA